MVCVVKNIKPMIFRELLHITPMIWQKNEWEKEFQISFFVFDWNKAVKWDSCDSEHQAVTTTNQSAWGTSETMVEC